MAYVQPTPATFKLRFPEFAGVPDALIQMVLDESFVEIDSQWGDDQARAQMYWTAHMLTMQGQPAGSGGSIVTGGAIKRDKVGDVETEFAGYGGYDAEAGNNFSMSTYGQEYMRLYARNFGGGLYVLAGPNGIYC